MSSKTPSETNTSLSDVDRIASRIIQTDSLPLHYGVTNTGADETQKAMVQSKISLILDGGEPTIKMVCSHSEEIVDTVFQMFAEKFGHVSTLCQVHFAPSRDNEKTLYITPVAPEKLAETCSKILEAQPRAEKFSTITGATTIVGSAVSTFTGDQLTEMAKPKYTAPDGSAKMPKGL